MNWIWRLLESECAGCGICTNVCEHHAIQMPREAAYPQGIDGACVGCMDCLEQCPFGALEITEILV